MLGIQKGTINIQLTDPSGATQSNVNTCTPSDTNFSTATAIYANPGKSFITKQVTFDSNVPAGNVVNTINDRIQQWIGANGERYDDLSISMVTSGIGTHDITIVITRNY